MGRIGSDLDLIDDGTISREHATIYPAPGELKIQNTQSKYGVYLNEKIAVNKTIAPEKMVKLQPGFTVRFGRVENIWRLERPEFVIVACYQSDTEIDTVKRYASIIDGRFQEDLDETCTHLVTTEIVITVKVLQAMIQGVPIVTPDYLKEIIAAAQENRPNLPKVEDFVPDIAEPYVAQVGGLLCTNERRRHLFDGKTFVFMVPMQRAEFEPLIRMAKGSCLSMYRDSIPKADLVSDDTIVVDYVPSLNEHNDQIANAARVYIASHDRRLVNELEIALAILHCSIDEYCNPKDKTIPEFLFSKEGPRPPTPDPVESTMNSSEEGEDQFIEAKTMVENMPHEQNVGELVVPNKIDEIPLTDDSGAVCQLDNDFDTFLDALIDQFLSNEIIGVIENSETNRSSDGESRPNRDSETIPQSLPDNKPAEPLSLPMEVFEISETNNSDDGGCEAFDSKSDESDSEFIQDKITPNDVGVNPETDRSSEWESLQSGDSEAVPENMSYDQSEAQLPVPKKAIETFETDEMITPPPPPSTTVKENVQKFESIFVFGSKRKNSDELPEPPIKRLKSTIDLEEPSETTGTASNEGENMELDKYKRWESYMSNLFAGKNPR